MTTVQSDPPMQAKAAPSSPGARVQQIMKSLGPFIGLFLVVVLFSIQPGVGKTFLSFDNFQLVLSQTVIVAIGALGMTMIIISSGIDLSVGSVVALTGVAAAVLMKDHHMPAIVGLLAAVILGGIVGAINGGLIVALRVTPFIVTLGTLEVARGVAKWIGNENAVYAPHSWIDQLTQNTAPGGVSAAVWIVIALAILVHLMLKFTVFGRSIFAIGSNEVASRLSGLRVDALKISIYALAGLFFGLSGIMQFARLSGMGDPTIAQGEELDVIAAVVIGGGSLSGGEGSILGSLIGALIMALLRNGSQLMGWPSYIQEIIIGVVIVVAVALDRIRHRSAGKA
ncbi:ribonucleotide-diphosphate reductase subunit alpha [Capsulimonas corticalis]|uniref:Ribonucleotide-diphosphate reductase subunit alpha n=1 Tax=Capsulimonas corticalis TaxID=2219043 RepID=A0A402D3T4_9BACT|nr:ABC transporter permease [Capsulimonas corticalis]BDI31841.1 ribonucleotide-diphosphate reductase subunit alpha [Capsulimonas corticalis]